MNSLGPIQKGLLLTKTLAIAPAQLLSGRDGATGFEAVANTALAACSAAGRELEAERGAREAAEGRLREARATVERKNVLVRWAR